MVNKLSFKKPSKSQYKVIGLFILLLALPLILYTVYQIQNTIGRATLPDNLETEQGVLSSSGVTKQSDSGASGGSYVLFNKSSNPTPTPNPTSPPPGSINVPSYIDAKGSTDVGAELRSFISTVPDGSTIVFPQESTYLCTSTCIQLQGRKNLTFWGYGSTIKNSGPGISPTWSAFHLIRDNHNLKIFGFKLEGSNEEGGTVDAYHADAQQSIGITMYINNTDIEMADLHVTNQWGHCTYIASSDPVLVNERITFRDSICEKTGVMGLTISSGRDITYIRNTIRDIGIYPFDIEDGTAGQPVENIIFSDNYIDGWSWNSIYTCHAVAGDSAKGLDPFSNIRIENNTFTGGDKGPGSGGCPADSAGVISLWGEDIKSNVYIRNNTFYIPAEQRSGWAIRLWNVNGGEVSGNVIPGMTVQCSDCSNVNISNNN